MLKVKMGILKKLFGKEKGILLLNVSKETIEFNTYALGQAKEDREKYRVYVCPEKMREIQKETLRFNNGLLDYTREKDIKN
jgi:hypothetical protein